MSKYLYVGNLSKSVTHDVLRELFSSVGGVRKLNIMVSGQTGRPRTYGFVEMESEEAAQQAIRQLNGQMIGGRSLVVADARLNESRTDLRNGQISYGLMRRR